MDAGLGTLIGWTLVVGWAMAFVIRPWKASPARRPLPVALGIGAAVWGLGSSWVTWRGLYDQGSWTAVSVTTGLAPLKTLLLALLAYAAGRLFLSARAGSGPAIQRWGGASALGLLTLVLIGDDIRAHHVNALAQHARDETLPPAEVQAIAARVADGSAVADEQGAFLGNALCPPDLLAQFASDPDVRWRRAVARNSALPADLAEKLAGDSDEEVRFMLAFNRELPPAVLSKLARDSSASVREMVAWTKALPEADFARLVSDPSANVRSTVAIQKRLSPAAREKLLADPEQRVRDAAARWQ